MNQGFWEKLKTLRQAQGKPFFILAPMADVTDMAFRQIVISCGKPDVLYTEFVSADGLASEKGRPKLITHLKYAENERPIVAQIFGSYPENIYKSSKLVADLGFDGIDINMGCPAGQIVRQNSGAGLIRNPKLAKEIIKEAKRAVVNLPVSVKTRIGYNNIITEEWVSYLIEAEPAAIIIHGRTMKEMSKVPAHWDEIGKAAELCKKANVLIVGNGDVASYEDGIKKSKDYGLDGVMIGRGIFSNPWFFNPKIDPDKVSPAHRIELLLKHLDNFDSLWTGHKNFDTLKRFFKIYITGWEGSKELRTELMATKNGQEVKRVVDFYLKNSMV